MQPQTRVSKQYCDKAKEGNGNPQVSCSKQQSAPLGGNTKAALDIVYRIVYSTIFTEYLSACARRRTHLYIILLDDVFKRPD